MHRNDPGESTLQQTIKKATVKDIVDAVLYLAQAGHVSGEILYVDWHRTGSSLVRWNDIELP